MRQKAFLSLAFVGLFVFPALAAAVNADPLPAWNDGAAKRSVIDFVATVTKKGSADFVKPQDRIAVFDNDGTLWAEQPMPFQAFFALDRVRALAEQHPAWKETQPFKAVLDNDQRSLAAAGQEGMRQVMMATHAGMTSEEFTAIVADWFAQARHPVLKRPYWDLVYQPMLELLAFLRKNGFKVYIVSGGGADFMRVFSERLYGIPPEQVIGSSIATRYEVRDGKPILVREPKLEFINDKEGKPIAINRSIGIRPIAAFGNSDGDFQMLEWTTAGTGARLGMLIRHDDSEREFAYDRDAGPLTLSRGLDEAAQRGWAVVSMRKDWKKVFSWR